MNYTALANELNTDPAATGYAALLQAHNTAGLAALLNAADKAGSTKAVPVYRSPNLLKWAAGGPRAALGAAAANASSPVQASAQVALDILAGAAEYLDLTDSAINGPSGLLQSLQSAGVITAAQLNSLLAEGTTTQTRAEAVLGVGTIVQQSDVMIALGIR